MYQTLDFPFMLFYVEGYLRRDVKEPYYDMLLLENYIKTIEYSIKPFVFTKSKILFAGMSSKLGLHFTISYQSAAKINKNL